MSNPQIKTEPGSVPVKPEPDSKEVLGGIPLDDDLYEDAGDFDLSGSGQDVWLTRIPRMLWENWSQLDDDEEIEIGTVRVEGPATDIKRISLRLNDNQENQDIPKDYNLKRQNILPNRQAYAVQNTFVFTEKDLPGYKDKAQILFQDGQTHGRSYLYEQMKRNARKTDTKRKKWEPYARKTIPKQTALAGRVHDEFSCTPVENEEYQRMAEERTLSALKPKKETKFIEKLTGKMLRPQTVQEADKSRFIQGTRTAKAKTQDNKYARMPQNELLDLIYACFREYRYWPFRSLKDRLRQPEAYLKQTLEIVGHLVKSGDFANTWELKPEAREVTYENGPDYSAAKQELAPDAGGSDNEPSGQDEDVNFETVL